MIRFDVKTGGEIEIIEDMVCERCRDLFEAQYGEVKGRLEDMGIVVVEQEEEEEEER